MPWKNFMWHYKWGKGKDDGKKTSNKRWIKTSLSWQFGLWLNNRCLFFIFREKISMGYWRFYFSSKVTICFTFYFYSYFIPIHLQQLLAWFYFDDFLNLKWFDLLFLGPYQIYVRNEHKYGSMFLPMTENSKLILLYTNQRLFLINLYVSEGM